MSKQEQVVKLLKKLGWKITFAESCTGGLAASTLVEVDGASCVFPGSFVTYSEEAKQHLIGVSKSTIEKYGVVSEQVASQMAEGCAIRMGSNIGVGITGYASPSTRLLDKPVGTICVAIWVNGHYQLINTSNYDPSLGRQKTRKYIVENLFIWLEDILKNETKHRVNYEN